MMAAVHNGLVNVDQKYRLTVDYQYYKRKGYLLSLELLFHKVLALIDKVILISCLVIKIKRGDFLMILRSFFLPTLYSIGALLQPVIECMDMI